MASAIGRRLKTIGISDTDDASSSPLPPSPPRLLLFHRGRRRRQLACCLSRRPYLLRTADGKTRSNKPNRALALTHSQHCHSSSSSPPRCSPHTLSIHLSLLGVVRPRPRFIASPAFHRRNCGFGANGTCYTIAPPLPSLAPLRAAAASLARSLARSIAPDRLV